MYIELTCLSYEKSKQNAPHLCMIDTKSIVAVIDLEEVKFHKVFGPGCPRRTRIDYQCGDRANHVIVQESYIEVVRLLKNETKSDTVLVDP